MRHREGKGIFFEIIFCTPVAGNFSIKVHGYVCFLSPIAKPPTENTLYWRHPAHPGAGVQYERHRFDHHGFKDDRVDGCHWLDVEPVEQGKEHCEAQGANMFSPCYLIANIPPPSF